ncbi:uncharacterized protein [Dermacentor andersoni]|uniref:uncharacterized protein n=1 Tax=Dermacentor andersoni TaxID=34620 RepID=UPI0021558D41|nr:uncharacterized protein LOC126535417 [Dermacentor andersoni]
MSATKSFADISLETSSQVAALWHEPLALHKLQVALRRGKRRSAPRADDVTPQMLCSLAASEQQRLFECFIEIWQSGQVPEAWRTAIVAPILKAKKNGYGIVVLSIDQQTGFRQRRGTADSIADMVSTLQDAKADGDLAMLLLIDVQGAFDSLPHAVVQQGLDLLGVQQESVVSPFLFNLALARLPAALPMDPHFPVQSSIYADDMALCVRGPPQHICKARAALQRALDTAAAYLCSIGLTISARKIEALLLHPRAAAHCSAARLPLEGVQIP